MSAQRKTYSAEFKSKVAVDAIRGFHTINELAVQYGVHPHQISMWKAQLLEAAPGVFSGRADQRVPYVITCLLAVITAECPMTYGSMINSVLMRKAEIEFNVNRIAPEGRANASKLVYAWDGCDVVLI